MDPNRDNPIIRFNTFWWALWAFFAFAVLLAIIMMVDRKAPSNLEDTMAAARYKTAAEVREAQARDLPVADIEKAIPETAARLAAEKPAPVQTPQQAIEGSAAAAQAATTPSPLGPTSEPKPAPEAVVPPVPVPAPAATP